MNGKRNCRRGLVLAGVSLFVAALAGVAWADVIDIPDQTLASAIRSQLNLPPDQPITDAEMLNLTGLSTGGEASLQGLQYARNLQALCLMGCQDALDLSPLAGLPLLSEVDLSRSNAPDLAALATLPSLSYLDILGNSITKLPNLANCPDLWFISAALDKIADISALTTLTNLRVLDLYGNPLNYDAYAIDIPIIIANNPGINISYDRVPEPPALCYAFGLFSMLSLFRLVNSRRLNNFWPLRSATMWYGRRASWNAVFITVLGVLACAGRLEADGIDIPDATLDAAIRAQLNLPSDQPITDMEMMSLTGLTTGGEASLQGLQYARNLQALCLMGCQDALDLSPLSRLPLLSEVDLSRCNAPDLSALATLPSLSYLDILGNSITKLPNLANCPDLWFICAAQDKITDISALTILTHLMELDLNGNPLNYDAYAIDIPNIVANNPGINISYDPVPEPPAFCYAFGVLTMLSLSRIAKRRRLNNDAISFAGRNLIRSILVLSITVMIGSSHSYGVLYCHWNVQPQYSGSWHDGNNWAPGFGYGEPDENWDVSISDGGTVNYGYTSIDHTIYSLQLGGSFQSYNSTLYHNAYSLTILHDFQLGGAGIGYYNLESNQLHPCVLYVDGNSLIGYGSGSSGYLYIYTGLYCCSSHYTSGNLNLGVTGGRGYYYINSDSDPNLAYVSVTRNAYVGESADGSGHNGFGQMTQNGGRVSIQGNLYLGNGLQTQGIYNLYTNGILNVSGGITIGTGNPTDPVSTLHDYSGSIVDANLTIRNNGVMIVDHSATATFRNWDVSGSLQGNSNYNVIIDGSPSFGANGDADGNATFGQLIVGNSYISNFLQYGNLNISNLTLGHLLTGKATFSMLSGTQNPTLNAGSMVIGDANWGCFEQYTGQVNCTGALTLANQAGSTGKYDLTYLGMQPGNLVVGGQTIVGNGGVGTFTVGKGASHTSIGGIIIGNNAGSSASYTLDGNGFLDANAGGISVGTGGGTGVFTWKTNSAAIKLNNSAVSVGANGTLDMCFDFDANKLLSGGYFQGSGSLNMASGTLKVDNGAAGTQNAPMTVSLGALSVNNGSYYLDGNSTLSVIRGISVGLDGNAASFQWHSGSINLDGNTMTIGPNGTLDMCYSFDANLLIGGGLFQGGGNLSIGSGTLMVDNGATGTQNFPGTVALGTLSITNGNYYLDGNGTLSASRGISVGTDGGTGVFQWHSGTINLDGNSITVGSNGTLDMCFNFDANALTSGSIFQGGGSLNISAGTLRIDNGAAATQNATQTFSVGMLSVSNGSYYLDGNGTLSASRGISVGADGNSGLFEWHSGTISVGGNAMTVDANGTLAMDSNFSMNDLFSGALFSGGGTLSIISGSLQVQNGATASVAAASPPPTLGTLYLTNGGLSLQAGSSGITVQNSLVFDGNSTLQSADPNNTIVVQPALGALAASSLIITTQDGNALSGLGNLTLDFQFDPNEASQKTINLEVAGHPYDPNLVVGGVDNNFSAANFVINTLVVGRQNADPNKNGTTLNLVNNYHNDANHTAVYVRNLVMAPGAQIKLNNFKLYYLVGNSTDGNTAKQFFPGDANLDGKVDGVDFLIWQSNYSQNPGINKWSTADFNGDRKVDGVDFLIWQANYPHSGLNVAGGGPAASVADPYSPARELIDTNGDGVISIEEAEKAFDVLK